MRVTRSTAQVRKECPAAEATKRVDIPEESAHTNASSKTAGSTRVLKVNGRYTKSCPQAGVKRKEVGVRVRRRSSLNENNAGQPITKCNPTFSRLCARRASRVVDSKDRSTDDVALQPTHRVTAFSAVRNQTSRESRLCEAKTEPTVFSRNETSGRKEATLPRAAAKHVAPEKAVSTRRTLRASGATARKCDSNSENSKQSVFVKPVFQAEEATTTLILEIVREGTNSSGSPDGRKGPGQLVRSPRNQTAHVKAATASAKVLKSVKARKFVPVSCPQGNQMQMTGTTASGGSQPTQTKRKRTGQTCVLIGPSITKDTPVLQHVDSVHVSSGDSTRAARKPYAKGTPRAPPGAFGRFSSAKNVSPLGVLGSVKASMKAVSDGSTACVQGSGEKSSHTKSKTKGATQYDSGEKAKILPRELGNEQSPGTSCALMHSPSEVATGVRSKEHEKGHNTSTGSADEMYVPVSPMLTGGGVAQVIDTLVVEVTPSNDAFGQEAPPWTGRPASENTMGKKTSGAKANKKKRADNFCPATTSVVEEGEGKRKAGKPSGKRKTRKGSCQQNDSRCSEDQQEKAVPVVPSALCQVRYNVQLPIEKKQKSRRMNQDTDLAVAESSTGIPSRSGSEAGYSSDCNESRERLAKKDVSMLQRCVTEPGGPIASPSLGFVKSQVKEGVSYRAVDKQGSPSTLGVRQSPSAYRSDTSNASLDCAFSKKGGKHPQPLAKSDKSVEATNQNVLTQIDLSTPAVKRRKDAGGSPSEQCGRQHLSKQMIVFSKAAAETTPATSRTSKNGSQVDKRSMSVSTQIDVVHLGCPTMEQQGSSPQSHEASVRSPNVVPISQSASETRAAARERQATEGDKAREFEHSDRNAAPGGHTGEAEADIPVTSDGTTMKLSNFEGGRKVTASHVPESEDDAPIYPGSSQEAGSTPPKDPTGFDNTQYQRFSTEANDSSSRSHLWEGDSFRSSWGASPSPPPDRSGDDQPYDEVPGESTPSSDNPKVKDGCRVSGGSAVSSCSSASGGLSDLWNRSGARVKTKRRSRSCEGGTCESDSSDLWLGGPYLAINHGVLDDSAVWSMESLRQLCRRLGLPDEGDRATLLTILYRWNRDPSVPEKARRSNGSLAASNTPPVADGEGYAQAPMLCRGTSAGSPGDYSPMQHLNNNLGNYQEMLEPFSTGRLHHGTNGSTCNFLSLPIRLKKPAVCNRWLRPLVRKLRRARACRCRKRVSVGSLKSHRTSMTSQVSDFTTVRSPVDEPGDSEFETPVDSDAEDPVAGKSEFVNFSGGSPTGTPEGINTGSRRKLCQRCKGHLHRSNKAERRSDEICTISALRVPGSKRKNRRRRRSFKGQGSAAGEQPIIAFSPYNQVVTFSLRKEERAEKQKRIMEIAREEVVDPVAELLDDTRWHEARLNAQRNVHLTRDGADVVLWNGGYDLFGRNSTMSMLRRWDGNYGTLYEPTHRNMIPQGGYTVPYDATAFAHDRQGFSDQQWLSFASYHAANQQGPYRCSTAGKPLLVEPSPPTPPTSLGRHQHGERSFRFLTPEATTIWEERPERIFHRAGLDAARPGDFAQAESPSGVVAFDAEDIPTPQISRKKSVGMDHVDPFPKIAQLQAHFEQETRPTATPNSRFRVAEKQTGVFDSNRKSPPAAGSGSRLPEDHLRLDENFLARDADCRMQAANCTSEKSVFHPESLVLGTGEADPERKSNFSVSQLAIDGTKFVDGGGRLRFAAASGSALFEKRMP